MEQACGELDSTSKDVAPAGRHCQEDGCATVLSIYNLTDYCTVHTNPRRVSKSLLRVVDKRF